MSKTIKPTTTWWLLAGDSLQGNVLLMPSFGQDTIPCLSIIAKKIFWLDNGEADSCLYEDFPNVVRISREEVNSHKYDLVIVNNITKNELSGINDICNNLTDTGEIIVCHKYGTNKGSRYKRILDKLYVFFIRNMFLMRLNYKLKVKIIYPTFIYGSIVYESQLINSYVSNKNNFLIKEKIKKIAYAFMPKIIITNGEITTFNKMGVSSDTGIFNKLNDAIKDSCNLLKQNEFLIPKKILYKYRKLIIVLSVDEKGAQNYVAVICMDDESKSQRDNEVATIKYLESNNLILNYLPDIKCVGSIYNHSFYFMNELQGFTIDVKSELLSETTKLAYKALLELSDVTISSDFSSVNEELDKFNNILNIKYPSFNDDHNKIFNQIDLLVSNNYLKSVCMHGDYKIENVVFEEGFNICVSGIIDWELSLVKGFPLLDLLYLLAYNRKINDDETFFSSYFDFFNDHYLDAEAVLIKDYLHRYGIDAYQYKLLLVIFFLHHFSVRFYFVTSNQENINLYQACLNMISVELKSILEVD